MPAQPLPTWTPGVLWTPPAPFSSLSLNAFRAEKVEESFLCGSRNFSPLQEFS